jgi:hypothetical protein
MKLNSKAIIVIIGIFSCVVVLELFFYFSLKNSTSSRQPVQQNKNVGTVQPTLTQQEVSAIESNPDDTFYKNIFCENQTNYIKIMDEWKKRMGADYDSWKVISTYPKGALESLILTKRLRGVISDVDYSNMDLRLTLTGSDGYSLLIIENENTIKAIQFVKLVNNVESPIAISDLKNGDTIVIEATSDITKPAEDMRHYIKKKYIKII